MSLAPSRSLAWIWPLFCIDAASAKFCPPRPHKDRALARRALPRKGGGKLRAFILNFDKALEIGGLAASAGPHPWVSKANVSRQRNKALAQRADVRDQQALLACRLSVLTRNQPARARQADHSRLSAPGRGMGRQRAGGALFGRGACARLRSTRERLNVS